MGMDYQYAGSASYTRFDEELKKVVEIVGGRESTELDAIKEQQNRSFVGYWFGYASSANSQMEKYIFPKGTDPLLVYWFNHIYAQYSAEDTKKIFDLLVPHMNAIKAVSTQIYEELKYLVKHEEGWELS